jgi:di/tricarboxylate transporter
MLLGMMVPSFALSMWASNMATTVVMLPIAEAVMCQLESAATTSHHDDVITITTSDDSRQLVNIQLPCMNQVCPLDIAQQKEKAANGDNVVVIVTRLPGNDDDGNVVLLPGKEKENDIFVKLPSNRKDHDVTIQLPVNENDAEHLLRLRETFKGYTLGVTYAARCGGSATLIGTVNNVAVKNLLDEYECT